MIRSILKKNILKAEANLLQGRIELCQSILVSCQFVKNRLKKSNEYFLETDEGSKFKKGDFYEEWKTVISYITKKKKTPHEARHTFETFLDNAGGNRKCIDMLMGHKSKDVGNRVYNHKTVEQLRDTILLLK